MPMICKMRAVMVKYRPAARMADARSSGRLLMGDGIEEDREGWVSWRLMLGVDTTLRGGIVSSECARAPIYRLGYE